MKNLISELRISVIATLSLAVIVCGIYPLVVWGVAQTLFPEKANGSLIVRDGKTIGSELLAQNFTDPKYFHPRPSAAGEVGYDATSSGGSNLGPTSKKLIDSVKERVEAYRSGKQFATYGSSPCRCGNRLCQRSGSPYQRQERFHTSRPCRQGARH